MVLNLIRNTYINQRFYLISAIIILLFIAGFYIDPFFLVAKISLFVFVMAVFVDLFLFADPGECTGYQIFGV